MLVSINSIFIEKLIKLTDDGKARWVRIPQYLEQSKNEPLRRYIIGATKYFYAGAPNYNWPMISEYGSYCTNLEGGTVCMLVYTTNAGTTEYKVALQPSNISVVETMCDCHRFQEDLRSLYDHVESGGRSYKCFFDDILKLE